MIAVILNSGQGSRLGELTATKPKCMVELASGETILGRQLRLLYAAGIQEFLITTGPYTRVIEEEARRTLPDASFTFVNNPDYATTNYIYSLYLARHELRDREILLLHGDLVFEAEVADRMVGAERSCVTVDGTLPLPDKDFKGTIAPDGTVKAIGVDVWDEPVVELQAFYRLTVPTWNSWLAAIEDFCESDRRTVYAENAFNENSDTIAIYPEDLQGIVCQEVDTPEDLANINLFIAKEQA